MLETAIALIVGFAIGYGVREWRSRRRRQAERRRRGSFWDITLLGMTRFAQVARVPSPGPLAKPQSPGGVGALTARHRRQGDRVSKAQADRGCHAALSRSIALRVVIIFRMTATMMTLDFLSAAARRLWKVLRAGL